MIDLNALRIEGFVEIEGLESEEHLVELARGVGKCLPNPDGSLISKVKANNGNCARQGTFSHAYGLSSFPMHTDTAYNSLPIRYLVLGMLKSSAATTTHINIKKLMEAGSPNLLKLARESVYFVQTFEQAKYTSVMFSSNGVTGVRYDPNIMTPANRSAKKFELGIRGQIYFHGEKRTEIPDSSNQNPARLPPNTAPYNPYTTQPLPSPPPKPQKPKKPQISRPGAFSFISGAPGGLLT